MSIEHHRLNANESKSTLDGAVSTTAYLWIGTILDVFPVKTGWYDVTALLHTAGIGHVKLEHRDVILAEWEDHGGEGEERMCAKPFLAYLTVGYPVEMTIRADEATSSTFHVGRAEILLRPRAALTN